MFWGAKNFLKNFQKYFSNRIEKLHKMTFIFFFSFFEKVWKSWKNWNYFHKIFVTMYSICYTRIAANLAASANRSCWSLIFSAINSSLASFLLSIFFYFLDTFQRQKQNEVHISQTLGWTWSEQFTMIFTQWLYIPLGQFRTNIFLIQLWQSLRILWNIFFEFHFSENWHKISIL